MIEVLIIFKCQTDCMNERFNEYAILNQTI